MVLIPESKDIAASWYSISLSAEFRYDVKQQQAVVDTILKGFPVNIMYWNVGENDNFEMIDGQQ